MCVLCVPANCERAVLKQTHQILVSNICRCMKPPCCTCCRWFGDEDPTWNAKEHSSSRASLASVEYNSQQRQPEAQPPPLAPSTALPNQQQQQQEQAATTATAVPTASASEGSSKRSDTASNDDSKASGAGAAAMETPGGAQGDSEKEAEQLSSLSRVIQQQQDTITKQVPYLAGHW